MGQDEYRTILQTSSCPSASNGYHGWIDRNAVVLLRRICRMSVNRSDTLVEVNNNVPAGLSHDTRFCKMGYSWLVGELSVERPMLVTTSGIHCQYPLCSF